MFQLMILRLSAILFLIMAQVAHAQLPNIDIKSGNLSAGSVSPGVTGSLARTLAAMATDLFNALSFTGIDPTGATDSSGAINAALAAARSGSTTSVFLPAGTYHLTHMLTPVNGQCLYGDSRGKTILTVGSDFSTTDAGVIQLSSSQDSGPCLHDLQILFTQPTADVVTTQSSGGAAAGSTVTVTSTANILVNGSVTDATAPTVIPALTTVVSVVGNLVTLSNPITGAGIGAGDSLHFGASRATFKTLAAGCTTGLGGTGCQYPPAILGASGRNQIYRVKIQGAWDGIYTQANNVMWLDNIEISAFDKGIAWDDAVTVGTLDFSHVHGYHFWNWGASVGTNLYSNVFADGGTYALSMGEVDGVNVVDLTTFVGRIKLTSNFSFGTFTGVSMDTGATFQVDGTAGVGLSILNLKTTGSANGTDTNCMLQVNGGTTIVTNLTQNTTATRGLCVAGASTKVNVVGGFENPNTTSVGSMTQSNGFLSLSGVTWTVNTGAGAWTDPLINSTGGALQAIGNIFNTSAGGTGIVAADNVSSIVADNLLNGWTFTPPGSLGTYQPRGSFSTITATDAVTFNTSASSGQFQINSNASGPMTHSTSGTISTQPVRVVEGSLATSNGISFDLGAAWNSSFNSGLLTFRNTGGTGSASNRLSMAIWGQTDTFYVDGSNNSVALGSFVVGAPTGGAKGTGTVNAAAAYYANGTVGVSCSGTPTASFASVNGIVTHC